MKKIKTWRKWTKEEDLFVVNNYKQETAKKIAEHLSRTPYSVGFRANLLGLNKTDPPYVGRVFYKLTVVAKSKRKGSNGESYYECKCECGNTVTTMGTSLTTGGRRSCGCNRTESRYLPPGEVSLNLLYFELKRGAERNDRECELTPEQHKEIILQDCTYCGAKPKKFNKYLKSDGSLGETRIGIKSVDRATVYVNTVDRIDSKIGYLLSNCVPACYQCNMSKLDWTVDEFIEHSIRIAEFQKEKNK